MDVSIFRKAQVVGVALEVPRVSWAPFWHLWDAFGAQFLEDFGPRSELKQKFGKKVGWN